MTARTRERYDEQMERLARVAFAKHEGATKTYAKVIGIDGAALGWSAGRVYIRRPLSGFYATEVVWLRHDRVLVHGDVAPVIVRAGQASFRESVHSLARSYIDYFAGKVNEGEAEVGSAYTCNADVFAAELRAEMKQTRGHLDITGVPDDDYGAMVEALAMIESDGDLDGAKRCLHDHGFDEVHFYGRVVEPRVWYAHAALKRLDAISGWRCPACDGVAMIDIGEDHPAPLGLVPCTTCNGSGSVDARPARGAA